MSSATPAELSASAIINLIDTGSYPRELVLNFARGFLPLEQDDVIAVLAHLSLNNDPEIIAAAQAALAETPQKNIVAFAANPGANATHLAELMRTSHDGLVLETLIRNRALTDEAVARLAAVAEPAVQDVIVINQARILRAPQILESLLANPRLTPDARRRALETREEFFEKKARVQEAAGIAPTPEDENEIVIEPIDAIADLLEEAEKLPEEEASPEPAAPPPIEDKDQKIRSVWAKIQTMTISQKVMLAFRGDKTVRMILVRERNKLVCSAAIRNPRMTLGEAEAVAGMRNVEDEVLRLVGMRRDWMSKYAIMSALIRNPRAPIGIVLPLINRLTLRDLKGLKDDRGVTEVVRTMARKAFLLRAQKS